ncbi:MAG: hypothetical protein ACRD96_20880, partial [Bryobacteraceae bacterium]
PGFMLVAWLALPALLALAWRMFHRLGLHSPAAWILTALLAVNATALYLSLSLLTELLFTSLLIAALLLAERGSGAAAGLVAGLAFLTKALALPFLVTGPLGLALRGRRREAALCFGAMLPFVAAWNIWARLHQPAATDVATVYYTSYHGFWLLNLSLDDLPLVVWKNVDNFLANLGDLVAFDLSGSYWGRHVARLVGLAAIAGAWRLARSSRVIQYPLAACGITAMLVVWDHTPSGRLVFPVFPLLLAGLAAELGHIGEMVRSTWRKGAVGERIAAGAIAAGLAGFGWTIASSAYDGAARALPRLIEHERRGLEARLAAWRWIAVNTPRDARLWAYHDPALYLYTGRRAMKLPLPSKWLYRDDLPAFARPAMSLVDFARQNRLDYIVVSDGDFALELPSAQRALVRRAVLETAGVEAVYRSPSVTILR